MKKRLIIIVSLVGVSAYFGYKHVPTPGSVGTPREQKSNTKTPTPGFSKFLKSARVSYRNVFAQDSKIPKECLDYFDALQKIDFLSAGSQADQLTYQLLPIQPQGCKGEFLRGFATVQKEFLKKCKPADQNLSEKISEECGSAIFLLRAAVTRLALKDKSISEITDMSQLTDLVFSELSGAFNGSQAPDFLKMKAVSERMLALDPDLYAAQKINVMANLMEGFMSPKGSPESAAAWVNTEASLKKALATNPTDETLQDAQIAMQTKGLDPVLTKELSQTMTEQNPNDDRAWYLLAFAEWKQGNHPGSIANLNHAISLAPQNQDYQNTLEAVSKPGANAEAFQGTLRIGISNEDFNH